MLIKLMKRRKFKHMVTPERMLIRSRKLSDDCLYLPQAQRRTVPVTASPPSARALNRPSSPRPRRRYVLIETAKVFVFGVQLILLYFSTTHSHLTFLATLAISFTLNIPYSYLSLYTHLSHHYHHHQQPLSIC